MGNGGEEGSLTGKAAAVTVSGQAPALLQSAKDPHTSRHSTKREMIGMPSTDVLVYSSTSSTYKQGVHRSDEYAQRVSDSCAPLEWHIPPTASNQPSEICVPDGSG